VNAPCDTCVGIVFGLRRRIASVPEYALMNAVQVGGRGEVPAICHDYPSLQT
jgi:hypothetical protein